MSYSLVCCFGDKGIYYIHSIVYTHKIKGNTYLKLCMVLTNFPLGCGYSLIYKVIKTDSLLTNAFFPIMTK